MGLFQPVWEVIKAKRKLQGHDVPRNAGCPYGKETKKAKESYADEGTLVLKQLRATFPKPFYGRV